MFQMNIFQQHGLRVWDSKINEKIYIKILVTMIVACFLPLVQEMISKRICARRKNCLKQHFWWQVDVSHSPRKFKLKYVLTFWGNEDWKMINLESLESPFVVPLMMTCPNDNIQLVSTSIAWFHGARETGTTGFLRTLYLYYIPDSKWLQAIQKLI